MANYLYGAAVQGIQGFIFQTNELRDIIGASALVEQVCTTAFQAMAGCKPNIIGAAGNIKHVFDTREQCERVVRDFQRQVLTMAPGITFSQAVVELDPAKTFASQVEELERKLRAQRNRPAPSTTLGLMAIKRAPKTGLPAVPTDKGELIDLATQRKRQAVDNMTLVDKSFGQADLSPDKVALNIEDMTLKNDWIAVIHADGNGLGQVVQAVGSDRDKFRQFSSLLDQATVAAAHDAYLAVAGMYSGKIPMRPVVLGGDDMTIIMRADLAVPYTRAFMRAFECHTRQLLGDTLEANGVFAGQRRLTCCAGIAFIKSSFPFHYGYSLAEQLCDQAKHDAKARKHLLDGGLPPSCVMFHKVQDSFVDNFADIERRELHVGTSASWKFGPYYLEPLATRDRWTIDDLTQRVDELDRQGDNARVVKSHLRQWMTLMHDSPSNAAQKDRRVRTILTGDQLKLWDELMGCHKPDAHTGADGNPVRRSHYPALDVLALHAVTYQDTTSNRPSVD